MDQGTKTPRAEHVSWAAVGAQRSGHGEDPAIFVFLES